MILDSLQGVILERKRTRPPDSYVSSLFGRGRDVMLKKIGEEAAEVIIASKSGDKDRIIHEMADLWFHCLVLMAEEGISHQDIFQELENRVGKEGK